MSFVLWCGWSCAAVRILQFFIFFFFFHCFPFSIFYVFLPFFVLFHFFVFPCFWFFLLFFLFVNFRQYNENHWYVQIWTDPQPPPKLIVWTIASSRSNPWPLYKSGQVRSGQVRSGQATSGQVRSGQVRSGQARPRQVRSGQVRSGQAMSCQVRSGQVRSGHVTSSQVMSCQVRSGQVRSRHVKSGQEMWFRPTQRLYLRQLAEQSFQQCTSIQDFAWLKTCFELSMWIIRSFCCGDVRHLIQSEVSSASFVFAR